ncbi:hypothetical protein KBY97_00460 [Synechococcus sp. ATX 2A4]|uniref:Cas10/Cmr2 second palm domain-containing protein n=1 Tax=Synechococcus sp. ATX 2A4 TaxID=2823727 RepID=UPI0020CFE822|nr:type III-B CRISPR-associated protein Cas10/Cmr2 [Synechococcus sp. ATX 2A4]MCP9883598.1 hypothetical protein [Synechococcus sp. ATX 2A4]
MFTVVTFAPVQGFISSSRKLRDLYGSSLLLSFLAKAIVDDAKQRGLLVISPAVVSTSRGTPNTLVISGNYKKGYGVDALEQAWGGVLDATRKWLVTHCPPPQFNYSWDAAWKLWHKNAWEMFHAQGETVEAARRRLAIRKNERAWTAINWTGESSTLGGADAICRPSMSANIPPWKLDSEEVGKEVQEFMGAINQMLGGAFCATRIDGSSSEELSLPELVKRLVTYKDVAKEAFRSPLITGSNQSDEKTGDLLPQRFETLAGSETTAWFMADGDGVGAYLREMRGTDPAAEPKVLHQFSATMRSWAEQLYKKVPDHMENKATVIYAGGDDLLGALHESKPGAQDLTRIDLFNWLENVFPALWILNNNAALPLSPVHSNDSNGHAPGLTISMGLVWAQSKVPQREALQHSREAEQSAKSHGRNRFTLRLLFRGDQHLEWVCPWWLLPKVRLHYRDREKNEGHNAKWRHLAEDLEHLLRRESISREHAPCDVRSPHSESMAKVMWNAYFPPVNGEELPPPITVHYDDPRLAHSSIGMPLARWMLSMAQVMASLEQDRTWRLENA